MAKLNMDNSEVTKQLVVSEPNWVSDADLEAQCAAQKKRSIAATLILAYTAVGVALGDLGTSPIYTLSAVFRGPPSEDEVLGAASIIFWAITLIVIVKYQLIVIRLNDHGEGGTFALYSLVARFCGFTPGLSQGSPAMADLALTRYSSSAAKMTSKKRFAIATRKFLRTNGTAQLVVLLLVLLMTSMVIGDGILTPAQTVLGAFGALTVKAPGIDQTTIAGISMGVLAILFLAQPLGTHRIGIFYAPIMLIWFAFNAVVGIHNIAVFYPAIFKVINPYYLYVFFRGNPNVAWQQTATCFLALTGAEASYADLGHFSVASMRIAFLGVLYPCVILCYLGQAAWMIKNPAGYATSFFSSIPWGAPFFYTYFVVAILAACVASQTMMSAAFSIVRQSMSLHCFPRVRVIHTSKKVQGQLWIPVVMVFMMVATIAAVGIFQNSVALGLSYGVCVSTLMLGTDLLIALGMVVVWEAHPIWPAAYLAVFGFIDGVFFTANLTKIPHGGWFAVMLAGIIAVFSYIWFGGTALKKRSAIENMTTYDQVISVDPNTNELWSPASAGHKQARPVPRLPGMAFMYTEHTQQHFSPTALKVFVQRLGSLPSTVVLLTVRQVPVSSVLPDERLLIRNVEEYPGIYHAVARYGYTDTIDHGPEFLSKVLDQVKRVQDSHLDYTSMLYVTVDAKLKCKPASSIVKRFFVGGVYNTFARLMVAKAHESWRLPREQVLELGVYLYV